MSLSAINIAINGMNAATRRLTVSASNVANVLTTGPVPDENGNTTAYQALAVRQVDTGDGPRTEVVPRSPGFELQYQPDNPDADENGMVAAPSVDLTTEMTDQLQASIVYKANVAMLKAATRMEGELLDSKS